MKGLALLAVLVASVIAEPPVDNRYLPPSQRGDYRTTSQDTFAAPAQSYGPPGRQTEALLRNQQSGFGARSQPSSQYGAPSRLAQGRAPSQQYGPPRGGSSRQSAPSNQYNAPSNQYIPPSNQFSAPSSQYGAPSNQFRSSSGNGPSANQYRAPSGRSSDRGASVQYAAPSQQYNAPEQGRPSDQYGPPSNQYLPPSARNGNGYSGDDESNNEPANYNFEYMVRDDETGNDFGHRESRQGGRAEGLYYVLLPDGRKQTVEYEADEGGYRPKISYEDTGAGAAGRGYDANSQDAAARGQGGSGPY